MDRNEKITKRKVINEKINTRHSRIKENEIDLLYDAITNEDIKDKTITKKRKLSGWCSEGKFTRYEKESYTIRNDEQGFRIEKKYGYCDDDGQSGSYDEVLTTAREIINLLISLFGKE